MYFSVHRDGHGDAYGRSSTVPSLSSSVAPSSRRAVVVDPPHQPLLADGRTHDGPYTSSRGSEPPFSLAVESAGGIRRVKPATLDERFRVIAAVREEQQRRKKIEEEEERQRRRQQQQQQQQHQQEQLKASTEARRTETKQRQQEGRKVVLDARRNRSEPEPAEEERRGLRNGHPGRSREPTSTSGPRQDGLGGSGRERVGPTARPTQNRGSAPQEPQKGSVKSRIKMPLSARLSFPEGTAAAAAAAGGSLTSRLTFTAQSAALPAAAATPAALPLQVGASALAGAAHVPIVVGAPGAANSRKNVSFASTVFGVGGASVAGAGRPTRSAVAVKKGPPGPTLRAGKVSVKKPISHGELDEDLDSYFAKKDD